MEKVFKNSDGQELAASTYGNKKNPLVIFLHGGGQTRFAWEKVAKKVSSKGFYVITYDLRGHGDSFWSEKGNYRVEDHKQDLAALLKSLNKPANLVGASLGGMTSLLFVGDEKLSGFCKTLIMVDIGIYPNQEGSEKILDFMSSAKDGFESLEEAANHISKFLPHRKKPKDLSGLNKNLRKKDDNRFYWHWDPKFLEGRKGRNSKEYFKPLELAASKVRQPTLLIRGALSDVLTDEDKDFFLEKVKHAEFEEIENAAHMVAGDKNDIFQAAILKFLKKNNQMLFNN